ncbi:Hypothetical protein NTJ_03970, partial [Nesidiocoris tenuis]
MNGAKGRDGTAPDAGVLIKTIAEMADRIPSVSHITRPGQDIPSRSHRLGPRVAPSSSARSISSRPRGAINSAKMASADLELTQVLRAYRYRSISFRLTVSPSHFRVTNRKIQKSD